MLAVEPSPARAAKDDSRPHAIVIGSGFGGLAAAVRLGARGWRVTVLEKLDAPGGRAYVHRQDGFTFDAGPTVITAPFLLEELWALAGKRLADDVDLRPVAPFYRVVFDNGTAFDYSGDAAAMRADVGRPGGLRALPESQRGDLPGGLRAARRRALRRLDRHGQGRARADSPGGLPHGLVARV